MILEKLKILGHRGAQNGDFHQNTLQSFERAFETADGIETDAVRSHDHIVHTIHDTRFVTDIVEYELKDRLNEESILIAEDKRINQMTAEQISNLRLKNNEKLPTLWEVIELSSKYKDKIINIELKGDDTAIVALKEVHKAINLGLIKKKQIIFSSFNHRSLLRIRKGDPDIKVGIIFSLEDQPEGQRLFPWSKDNLNSYIPFSLDYLKEEMIRDINPDFFNIDETVASKKNIDGILEKFPYMKIMIWSLSEPEPKNYHSLIEKLENDDISRHIHSVITNYPKYMIELLKNRKIIN